VHTYLLAVFVYPCLLALLCVGAGLLVDRVAGGWLAAALLPVVGAAALIALSQLSTYSVVAARATPYAMAAVCVCGFALGRHRVMGLVRRWRSLGWRLTLPVLVYALAIAPVLFSGQPSFSDYGALTDSAVHMIGANYLISHGQSFAHLDLRNSYGEYIHDYYADSYPSGADTLFGGSAFLLPISLIWVFQPFNAFVLATAFGPAWMLAGRAGLRGRWAAVAALTVTVPALVYGYDLIGSVKEITALPMILALGVLVSTHRRWLTGDLGAVVPVALIAAAGVAAIGVSFMAWVLPAVAVLLVVLGDELRARRLRRSRALLLVAVASTVGVVGALGTWVGVAGSLRVAQAIAATSSRGNLAAPLAPAQVAGTWLSSSYRFAPKSGALTLSSALIAITLLSALVGLGRLLASRQRALAGWIVLTLASAVALTVYGGVWTDAKLLVLASPLVLLLAWAGVAVLRRSRLPAAAAAVAAVIAGGVLVSDALQYRGSDLAPSARYAELASLDAKYAGQGPALFTDFDEWSLYELRDVDIGGPDFTYPPVAEATLATGHGAFVRLDSAAPASLRAYRLIIARRDPATRRPPSAYVLAWQGSYYQVWRRLTDAPSAITHVELNPSHGYACWRIGRLAALAYRDQAHLVSAVAPQILTIPVNRSRLTDWRRDTYGVNLDRPGRLTASFWIPRRGVWDLWLQGEIMPVVQVSIDGHRVATVADQLDGNLSNPDTTPPLPARLAAGRHTLTISRGSLSLAPGNGGTAMLRSVFLTPAHGPRAEPRLQRLAPDRFRVLCGESLQWIEVVPDAPTQPPGPVTRVAAARPGPPRALPRSLGARLVAAI